MQKPRALNPGDTLGFVDPSGALQEPERLSLAADAARRLGFQVKIAKGCLGRYGYLAGDDVVRADDLNSMFRDDSVDAIICVRGGYGTPRILDRLDYEAARAHPKILLGFSDITGLHLAYAARSDLVTFQGPMPSGDWAEPDFAGGFTERSMLEGLTRGALPRPILNPANLPLKALCGGRCEGKLIGGNLTLIASLMGTGYLPDFSDSIVLIEDVDEEPYRVDRMLTQLRLSGVFQRCAGVVLGGFCRCEAEHPEKSLTLEEIFRDVLLPAGKPVLSGFMLGHQRPRLTVPFGVRYALDADRGTLTLLESPFRDGCNRRKDDCV